MTNSIQDTVCLELGMYSRTASSYKDLICQNLSRTQQSIELKDSPTNFFRMLLCHFLHTLYKSVHQFPNKLLPLRSSPQHLAYAVLIQSSIKISFDSFLSDNGFNLSFYFYHKSTSKYCRKIFSTLNIPAYCIKARRFLSFLRAYAFNAP